MSEKEGLPEEAKGTTRGSPTGKKAEECVVIALSDFRRLSSVAEAEETKTKQSLYSSEDDNARIKSERIQSAEQVERQGDKGHIIVSLGSNGSGGSLRGYSVSVRRDTITLVNAKGNEEYELAHKFEEHTYGYPTYCDVCTGLLAGLWSQGMQCASCGMNTHRGGGIGDHDDCRAEAMLAPCDCVQQQSPANESKTLREAMREVQELARERPNFFRDVRAQMDRDVMTHVTNVVVSAGVDGERDKKFRRTKEKIVPLLEFVDGIEEKGEIHSLILLLSLHGRVALFAAMIGILGFILAVLWRHGRLTESSFHLALIHESTVLFTVHIGLLIVAAILRYYTSIFKRKVKVIDQFLRDKFGVDAKEDFGISVAGAARRARWWSERIFISAAITAYAAVCFWYAAEPSMNTLLFVDHGVCPADK